MFDAAEAAARYEPRPDIDAPRELFAERLALCQGCPHREGHRCPPADQLCSILSRPLTGFCPLGHWGTRPPTAESPERVNRDLQQPTDETRPADGPLAPEAPLLVHPPLERRALVRNLVCHLFPLTAGGKWRRTVAHLAARRNLFNGRRLVAIARDHECDSADEVRAAFHDAQFECQFLDFANEAAVGEVRTFVPLLSQLAAAAQHENHVTFYCHTKGATWPESRAPSHEWADVMFASCLDYPELVRALLSQSPICGSFRHHSPIRGTGAKWHYSGTFFWFRNDVVFDPLRRVSWRSIAQSWCGTEAWPGVQFSLAESACLFSDNVSAGVRNLYHQSYWDDLIRPAWRRWKTARREELQGRA